MSAPAIFRPPAVSCRLLQRFQLRQQLVDCRQIVTLKCRRNRRFQLLLFTVDLQIGRIKISVIYHFAEVPAADPAYRMILDQQNIVRAGRRQIEVVRHHEYGPAVSFHRARKRCLCIQIQMTGRLVEQQQLRAAARQYRQLQ